ncbi:MAG: helix-turn-helix transcriptional regulator [Elusimicrobia bacterium]|nr:helix-turn-helix transcriptional regulator [Elusimicrobiota bacterium]
MSQMDLARKLGCPQSGVSRLESGRRSPTLRELVGLAKALNTPLSDLLRELEGDFGMPRGGHSMLSEPAVSYGSVPAFHEAQASEEAVMAQLAAHGVQFLGKQARAAVFKLTLEETLLAALRFADEPRLFEALPTLLLRNAAVLDWSQLVSGALMLQLQNRLGMVVAAALQLKGSASDVPGDTWRFLDEVHGKLAEARLDRQEFLGPKPSTHEGMEDLAKRTPPWLRAWHAFGSMDIQSLSRHLPR